MATNIDQGEVQKYDAWAHMWWQAGGQFAALRSMHRLRLAMLRAHVSLSGLRVLDVGCGGGLFAELLASEGAKVTGIDPSDESLAMARRHAQQVGLDIEYRAQELEHMARADPGGYDLVSCTEVLEHVPDPAAVVRHIGALARPGGWVFLSTMNRTVSALVFGVWFAEHVFHFAPPGAHQWRRFIRPHELEAWAGAADLQAVDRRGVLYDVVRKRFFLTPILDVNYNLLLKKGRGAPA
ncbi:MAG: bifunctional 2-polyprenyl-6-hydroxyphenol methylase/3-demethylubiquinol 3-O-methyltransferase UbiG [candidate division Zixibacteria bacterium]|nr:bifunctional 2-polyprenyl-6-hydroxyphenol methylase/3-demethylubiquinol 3-O-methyltransferase UbiG [candidate division Zixibacteria bacterium]